MTTREKMALGFARESYQAMMRVNTWEWQDYEKAEEGKALAKSIMSEAVWLADALLEELGKEKP